MDIFLSWSGDTSKQIAQLLKNWLPTVIQCLQPFYSPDDISKGKSWGGEISKVLNKCDFGILILTKDNIRSPWILFEAGALSKNIDLSRVCTMLFGIKDTDVEAPLNLFQNTKFEKEDIKKLMVEINHYLGSNAIKSELLILTFDKMWADLESGISKILSKSEDNSELNKEIRSDRELIEETVGLLRDIRYNYIPLISEKPEVERKTNIVLNKKRSQIIFYEEDEELYWLYLDQLNSSAAILDFIFQINRKRWCSPRQIQAFIDFLEELSFEYFGTNAQGSFCPFGDSMRIDWKERTTSKM